MRNKTNDSMPIFKEVKRIACLNAQYMRQYELLERKGFDMEGIEWDTAELVSGLTVRNGYLFEDGCQIAEWADEYYCDQWQGYSEDSYSGWLYFRTDVPGQYVRVHFGM